MITPSGLVLTYIAFGVITYFVLGYFTEFEDTIKQRIFAFLLVTFLWYPTLVDITIDYHEEKFGEESRSNDFEEAIDQLQDQIGDNE